MTWQVGADLLEFLCLLDWIILSLVIPDNSLAIKPNDAVNVQFYK